MNNLLLFEDRQGIVTEYRRRRLVVVVTFVLITIACALILLLAIYGSLFIKLQDRDTALRQAVGSQAEAEARATHEALKQTRLALRSLPKNSGVVPSHIFTTLIAARPAGIAITSLAYVEPEAGTQVVIIEGQAATRKALVVFIDSLKANTSFAAVDSPLSNVIRDTSSHFAITVTIKSPKP